ncbi:unnamed protein product [Mesocestoides corti]|uniref:F5/8 type C domain-containing protein n=1 Tax=Mesocestoides corti TaxID=53468 RepID=A0A0R3UPW8_MESCO|nr:unnamed protein product [Mesocestoides corti]
MDLSATVTAATSNDELFSPENVLNIKENNFWLTTGIFPQSLIISLMAKVKLSSVKLISACVKTILVETSPDDAEKFKEAVEMNVDSCDGQVQITRIPLNGAICKRIKLTILSAYDHFAAVYKFIMEQT